MVRGEIGLKLYKKYTKVTKLLVEICDVARGIDENLNTQDYLGGFDLILQSVLFFQSKSNKAIYPKEKSFIEDLTEERDILLLAKQALAEEGEEASDVEWNNVFQASEEVFSKIEGKIKDLSKICTQNLVAYLALAECLDGKNYFGKLSDEIVDLLYYFAKLENGVDDNEVKHGIMAYCRLVADYYVSVITNMEEFFADKQIKKELLGSLRKEYKETKRSNRFLERHLKSIKDRLAGLFKKDKDNN